VWSVQEPQGPQQPEAGGACCRPAPSWQDGQGQGHGCEHGCRRGGGPLPARLPTWGKVTRRLLPALMADSLPSQRPCSRAKSGTGRLRGGLGLALVLSLREVAPPPVPLLPGELPPMSRCV
jgi:hypothetical protein